MPAYNFKARFADAVETGEKRQTIRPRRKHPIKPGDSLYLFTGMRTKQCRRLLNTTCCGVTPINIFIDHITIDGKDPDFFGLFELARADGFDSIGEMYQFFENIYGLPLVDKMEIIEW